MLLLTFVAHANELTQVQKLSLAAIYREDVQLRKDFPNDLAVDVIFADVNLDGKTDAMAACRSTKYQDGWDWILYLGDGENGWNIVDETEDGEQNGLFALPSDFYRYGGTDAPAHILIIKKGRPEDSDGEEPPIIFTATRIKIAENGSVVLEEMARPTNEQLAKYEKLTCEKIGE